MTTNSADAYGFAPDLQDTTGASTANRYSNVMLVTNARASGNVSTSSLFKKGTSSRPTFVNPRYMGQNGFYTNGPTFNPMAEAQARQNAVEAYTKSWSDPAKKDYLDRFASLVSTYGNTNSAGVLTALAESGLDHTTPAVQGVLKADAAASAANIGTSKPALATNMATDSEENWFQNLMQPVETMSRLGFQVLNAPFQAIDATFRTIGGGIAALAGDEAARERFASMITSGGIASQTDLGQTIKSMFLNPTTGAFDFSPWDAITQYQAGLDVNRAMKEIQADPANAALLNDPSKSSQMTKMAEELAKKNGWYSEPGWFVDETSQIGEAQRRATYDAWAIPGPNNQLTAWTMGRGIASATFGPDSQAYSMMSGIIDATWNIVADPLTYTGGVGLVSKGIEVGSKLATGGEKIIRIGKAGEKWRKAIAADNIINAKTVEEYNAKAAEIGFEQITAAQFAGLEAARQADIVKSAQKGNVTQGAMDDIGLNMDVLENNIADLRRAASMQDKVAGINYTSEDVDALKAARDLTTDYLNLTKTRSADGVPLVDLNKVAEWEAVNGPEALDQIKNYATLREAWRAAQPEMTEKQAYEGFNKFVNETIAANEGVKGSDNAARAISDAMDAAVADPFDVAELGDNLPLGVTLRSFDPTVGMQGVTNGSRAMVYADKAKQFVVRGGDDIVDEPVRKNLLDSFMSLLDDPRLNKPVASYDIADTGSLAGVAAEKIAQADNAKPLLEGMFNDPTATFGSVLQLVTRLGLDGYLDDYLRKNGIDGISDGAQSGNKGTWFGEHPSLEAYRVPDDIADIAAQAVDSGDPQAFIAAINKGDRVDLHGLSGTDSLIYMARQNKKYADILESSRLYDSTLIDKARIGQTKADKAYAQIDEAFQNPEDALKSVMSHEAGMRLLNGMGTLDAAGVRNFLFGFGPSSKMAKTAFEALSSFLSKEDIAKVIKADGSLDQDAYKALRTEWNGKLYAYTGGKWDASTIKSVFDNALYERGVDGLIDTLAPRLGIDVSQGSISKTVAVLGTDGLRDFRTWRSAQPLIKRTLYKAIKTPEYLGRVRPNSRPVELLNTDQVAHEVTNYGRWVGLSDDEIAGYVGRVIEGDGTFGAAAVNRNVLVDMFKAIGTKVVDDLDKSIWYRGGRGEKQKEELIKAIGESTSVYLGGKTGEKTRYGAQFGDSVTETMLNATGGKIDMPNFMIDSELATGFVNLPSVDDLMAATTRLGRALSRLPKGADTYGVTKKFYDNFFRTALLVGRVSYILRNSAEMQIRMFLNGHESVFNSPATLIGMTIGNMKGRGLNPNSVLGKTFSPYKDTILGTAFEVGTDAQLAAANHTEEYFKLIRQSHALTDQRVYNSAIRQGWKPIAATAPRFNDGWAHELIMLHRSDIARLVLMEGTPPYPGKIAAGSQYDDIMNYFLSDAPEMDRLRKIMLAGDEEGFTRIFSDRVALKDYLFENDNSVLNRIKTFTYGDPRLEQFVRSGMLDAGGKSYDIAKIADMPQRVKDLGLMLKKEFRSNDADNQKVVEWFDGKNVKVPWVEKGDGREGNFLVNKFFDIANSFERLGSVGPEFRMAYWDKIAELAPTINAQDVDKALESAKTTLGVLRRLNPDGTFNQVGKTHPAWAALKKAKESGDNGNLSLMEVHDIAMKYAAEDVTNLFYDAARRNDMWSSLRLLFPFGQAWGNTIKTWGELGAKNPVQVYKIQKVLNGAQEEGSSSIYEMLDSFGVYPDYAPGGAPYDQDASGGFFYQDKYGDTKFMLPFGSQMAGVPLSIWSKLSGVDTPSSIGVESPVQSLNFALGGDSLLPGVSAFAATGLNIFPDNEIVQKAKSVVAPFGSQNVVEASMAPWIQQMVGGAGSVPIVGGALENFVGVLAPQKKNKYLSDAMSYLAGTGNYNLTDPESVQKLNEDAKSLGGALLLTGGLFQNVSPASPQFQVSMEAKANTADMTKTTGTYAISMFNLMKQGYMARNGNDSTAANLDMVDDFGPAALFALVGDWKGMGRLPTSEALSFAYKYPEIAKAYNGEFQYFFPGGDSSDVQAREWAERNAQSEAVRKSPNEISEEVISWMIRVQRSRLDSFYQAGTIDEAKYDAGIADLKDRYQGTMPANTVFALDKTDEMNKFKYMYDKYPQVQNSKAGLVFGQAWAYREQALSHARGLTGDPKTTLNGKKTAAIRDSYLQDIDTLIAQHPEFKLLGLKFKKEFE